MNPLYHNLKFVGRCLALPYDEKCIADVHRQIMGGSVSWELVIQIANNHLVTPGLWIGLKASGLDVLLDDEISRYLSELHKLNRNRNAHLKRQLLEAVATLNAAGITPLLFKGSGQLVHPLHEDSGIRIMSDLDILIPADQLATALEALNAMGYREAAVSYDPHKLHHWAPLLRPGDYGSIELHREALHKLVSQVLPTEGIWQNALYMNLEGVKFCLPCPTHAVLICMLHSREFRRLDDPRQFNLRFLHDLAAITGRYPAEIDWHTVQRQMKDHGLSYVAESQLLAAQRLMGAPLPAVMKPGTTARLHHIVSLASMQWSAAELLSHRLYDFSAFQIRRHYGCSLQKISLAAFRMRYLFALLNHYFTALGLKFLPNSTLPN